MAKLAINGFGRIGRLVLRALLERQADGQTEGLQIVAINDLAAAEDLAQLFRLDSIHGRFNGEVKAAAGSLIVNGEKIAVTAEPMVEKLDWARPGVDLVLECTGRAKDKAAAVKHLQAGAKKVLISAPAKDVDLTIVYGINHRNLPPTATVFSNASCTTNCLAPMVYVAERAVGFDKGYMTTVHSYTQDQRILDAVHSDPYRSRAAALSIIPTTTGAAKAVSLVLPHLKGKLDGCAIRVPTPNVSMVDLTFNPSRPTDVETLNAAFTEAAAGELKGVVKVTTEPLVSADLNHESASATVDLNATQVIDGNFCRLMAWYDNEWGFSNRMLDTAAAICGE